MGRLGILREVGKIGQEVLDWLDKRFDELFGAVRDAERQCLP
jgi:hypothetical protein